MYVFVVDIYLLIIVLESKSSVTVKLLPIVTSLGKPTVKVLFAVKSWAPVGETSTSLDVPASSIVLAWGVTVIEFVPSVITFVVEFTPLLVNLVLSASVIIYPDPALKTSDNSVTLCVDRFVKSVGLLRINESAAVFV